ncbi:MAG: aminotransferase class I/II-fold pyridoxal phosphate-dependent enzyme [Bacillota bacterium]|nr:aminotransferase class I/II-fold pyridoxal phosphate-dependent enzyme [Bacillota bacterium]MDD3297409.1 aminotransferase class I/II-fold pyridoxal phosphate-dependent enzyme [Bacillota bacterium]MDD3851170.1 aminotransferase class I/II-fold pyridoxal phosphate-dependent enzyme [Bacillota bacterium]MDD4707178.1 aminotransferase class I/II-fold pyridoxal phosphate-dependent enzyme [Bacillota bacterium]
MLDKEQNRVPLFEALKDYHSRNVIPFDVPGHKHGAGLPELADYVGKKMLEIDVNAMECLDNISNPIGVIREAEALAARAYGADNAFFLVNGTTSGVQAMIMAACRPGEKIILPRNAHKSAIAGMILSGAVPIYIQPEINGDLGIAMGITADSIKQAIESHPDARAIFVIHPTYYGAVSDLAAIAKIAHRYGMAVLADEAHGAHFNFHPQLPASAMELGADASASSIHKTGGSLTQSSMLLMRDDILDPKYMKTTLNLTQTTSASYLLMASLDIARKQLATRGRDILGRLLGIVREAKEELNSVDGLYAFGRELVGCPGVFDYDDTKLGVNVRKLGLSGYETEKLLRKEYNIQVELADMYNILAITAVGDTKESIGSLVVALKDLAKYHRNGNVSKITQGMLKNPEIVVSPRDAYYSSKKSVPLEEAVGYVSGESIMVYPPGIPLVTPGEMMTEEIVAYAKLLKEEECMLQGTQDPYVDTILVLGQ